jgi:hypothetical protein
LWRVLNSPVVYWQFFRNSEKGKLEKTNHENRNARVRSHFDVFRCGRFTEQSFRSSWSGAYTITTTSADWCKLTSRILFVIQGLLI